MSTQHSAPQPPHRPPRAPRIGTPASPTTLRADSKRTDGLDTTAQPDRQSTTLAESSAAPAQAATVMADVAQSSRGQFVSPAHAKLYPPSEEASFTFVCLGVGGGPIEGDCSCYIMKPAQRKWDEGSVVVEGGSWLGALSRVCEDEGASSAFFDVDFPFEVPALRAGYLGSFAHSFLLSHAHLDHILGMVLGSASLPGKRKVYGLKSSLENLMGVFNGKVWPKLATWGDGPGPAVYQLYPVEPQKQLRIDECLTVIPFALSHGLNPSEPPAPPTPAPVNNARYSVSKRLSLPLNSYFPDIPSPQGAPERTSFSGDRPVFTSPFAPETSPVSQLTKRASVLSVAAEEQSSSSQQTSPRASIAANQAVTRPEPSTSEADDSSSSRGAAHLPPSSKLSAFSRVRRPRTAQGSEKQDLFLDSRAASVAGTMPNEVRGRAAPPKRVSIENIPALDSTAFFITNERTGKDVLFFGDVEPDSVSQNPRNGRIWAHAAKKFAAGKLNAIFLECSFPASHPTAFLYGHLSVAHVFDELRTLAIGVVAERKRMRARQVRQQQAPTKSSGVNGFEVAQGEQGVFRMPAVPTIPALNTAESSITAEELGDSLQGLSIIIIHVKTALFPSYETAATTTGAQIAGNGDKSATSSPIAVIDPRSMRDRIFDELNEAEEVHRFGVRFVMAQQGLRIEC